jgi:hypothetical protein
MGAFTKAFLPPTEGLAGRDGDGLRERDLAGALTTNSLSS